MKKIHYLITCEHGGNRIPKPYQSLFHGKQKTLASHRGYDIGALELAKKIAQKLKAPHAFATTSRLLVDLNRSLHHPKIFSEITHPLSHREKENILAIHYLPHRTHVESLIRKAHAKNLAVIHLAIHSFTPVLNGTRRQADIGFLFDPQRKEEKIFCTQWKKSLLKQDATLNIRFNYPYRGTSDGFTTYLRKKFSGRNYVGIELEMNQAFPLSGNLPWKKLKSNIVTSLVTFPA